MSTPGPALQLSEASRRYRAGSDAFALAPTTLTIAAGTWVALAGRSGSGKTTLLNLLAGLDRPDSGRVLLLGHDLGTYSDAALSDLRRERVGIVHQSFHLLEHLPVWQNVTVRLVPAGVSPRARRERAAALLGELGLADVLERMPRGLSGGEKQRVALARALCGAPAVLIADEPTSNVDAETGAAIADRFARLRAAGTTIVVATHDPALAARADVRRALDGGRLLPP